MGKTDIEWIVLKYSEDGKSALVISKYIVEMTAFDDNLEEATWENSGIRKWLNGDFFKGAFTKSERSLIKKVKLKNSPNSEYGTNGGKDTNDRIFLLSEEQDCRWCYNR